MDSRLTPQNPRNNSMDWLKWVAITTMFVDHLRFVPQLNYEILYSIGRASYPLFAIICAYNLAIYTKSRKVFCKRVLLYGCILMAVGPFTLVGPLPLNPLITLGLGLFLSQFIISQGNRSIQIAYGLGIGACGILLNYLLPMGVIISYGWIGISIIPITTLYALRSPNSKLYLLIWGALVLILAYLLNEDMQDQILSCLWALLALVILYNDKLRPCPLPNNYWLYLSFPLSMLLPSIIQTLIPKN